MRRTIQTIGTALLFLIVALCLATVCVPPFLDRVYYHGPRSNHFDGARFFNPGREIAGGARLRARMIGFLLGKDRPVWPASVPVTPGYPPAAARACPPAKAMVSVRWGRCVPRVAPDGLWVTWIGHATALVQTQGLAILTDPVWSDRTGPFQLGPKRVRAPGIGFKDLPKIDVVLLSHDHYDHLDLPTLKKLWARDHPLIVTSLGNDAILRANGIGSVARDWGGHVAVRPGIDVIVERVHHWGTRWNTDRNRALWSGFTVSLPGGNLFYAGDTGWGDGSWTTAARRGPVRLAILPIGAFKPRELME
ncbi:MAG: hypothetical protein EOP59_16015, partial [Sphingomonadales bacterium]